jgi:hypothetical protein
MADDLKQYHKEMQVRFEKRARGHVLNSIRDHKYYPEQNECLGSLEDCDGCQGYIDHLKEYYGKKFIEGVIKEETDSWEIK